MPRFNRPFKLCGKQKGIQVFQREHSIKSGIDVKIQPTYFKIRDIDCISVALRLIQILIKLQDNLSR